MKKSSNKGFTLVELIIVIAILAIIMLIAIPNFSGIQQRMQVRADKSTAAQIGKAVRVWFTDYTTDENMLSSSKATIDATAGHKLAPVTKDSFTGLQSVNAMGTVKPDNYENLVTIDEYISRGQKPTSLRNNNVQVSGQLYGVFLTKAANDTDAKIGVAIISADKEQIAVKENVTNVYGQLVSSGGMVANYDGTNPGVAYIEP